MYDFSTYNQRVLYELQISANKVSEVCLYSLHALSR